jgi:hypothetical protein
VQIAAIGHAVSGSDAVSRSPRPSLDLNERRDGVLFPPGCIVTSGRKRWRLCCSRTVAGAVACRMRCRMCNPLQSFAPRPSSRTRAGGNQQKIEDDRRCDDGPDVGETFSQPA